MNLADIIATLPTPPAPAPVSTYRSYRSMCDSRRRLRARLAASAGQDTHLANRIDALNREIARADQRERANR